jgi:hypothetical protein
MILILKVKMSENVEEPKPEETPAEGEMEGNQIRP